ncbi:MAG: hypothetical protein KDC79_14450 [Cyclobacteriaceae bacterium]|nr:hypothetical protein [Cyclobacteriaceae bacterium]
MKKRLLTYLFMYAVVLPLSALSSAKFRVISYELSVIGNKELGSNTEEPVKGKKELGIENNRSTIDSLLVTNNQLTDNHSLNPTDQLTNQPITNNQLTNQPATSDPFPVSNDQLQKRSFPELDNNFTRSTLTKEDEYPLYEEGIIPNSGPEDSVQYYINKASAIIKEIRDAKKFVGYLNGESLLKLPVGIHKEVGGLAYDIGIASIKLKPQYAELEVYMQFEVPQNGKVLTFRGKGIKFTKEGGIVGDATLELVADYAINLDGDKAQIILKSGTQATFSCNGFEKMILNADVKFARSMLLPEDVNGNVKAEGNVITSFRSEINDWNDLVAEVDLPAFQLPSLEGVSFTVRQAVFDFSDTLNASGVRFPENYQNPDIAAGLPQLWRGFYIRELSVTLPRQFEKQGNEERTSFAAFDVLIDNMGLTGDFEGKNLIRMDEGSMSGWAYSLDSIGISLQANQLTSGGFIGDIVIPINKEDKAFAYNAIINPGGAYIFNVSASDSLEFSMFKASKVELFPASYLEIAVVDNKFVPKANLHGKMSINAPMSDQSSKTAELADISFENLQIQSQAPYIQVGAFSFGTEGIQQRMSGFPISINNIGLRNVSETEVALDFNLQVNLTGSGGGSYGADAGLSIVGELPQQEAIQHWRYKKIEVRDISVDIDGGAFKLNGMLQFYTGDPVYGDGFNGTIQAEFKPGIRVEASAVFGTVDGYRYWYADALASMPSGVPIFTGVAVYGFGGGAYYHMAMDTDGSGSTLGQTSSGIVYVPRENAGLGLKATIEIGSHPKKEAFNGDATFEVAFFDGGGIRYISFKGNGYLATPPAIGALSKIKEKTQKMASVVSQMEKSTGAAGALLCQNAEADQSTTQIYGQIGNAAGERGQISAHVFISYDFENNTLHGNFEAYVNVAGGIIKGVGDGGRAGWAVLHFAPEEWYVYVGTPDDRIGLKMGVGPISAQTTSYLMVGTSILGSPPPPENIARILGMDASDLDYMRDLNALGKGAGFAFGANFGIDTGDLTFLMFYARFAAGAGFDIMLKDYGSAQCSGRSGPIGVNGWYANGQAYAYFEGKIGIKVKLFGKSKKVNILDIGAAALLQAKLPNPFWMRGIVGGHFSVLGGLVKGSCKFEVTIGEECEIVGGSVLEGINVIADLTPQEGVKDVDVFTTPQAVFNMPIEKVFEMVDTDERKKSFRIRLEKFELVDGTNQIAGNINWNDNHDVAAFDSYEVFPSEKEIKVVVQVSFEEKVSGRWTSVIVDGKKYVEKREATFTSGVAPDYIPLSNVEYCYPVANQLNFYKDEYNKGYIKLKKGQAYLFDVDQSLWKQKGRFTSTSGTAATFDFAYAAGNKEVNFSLPSGMQTSTIYAFELVNLPVQSLGKVDRNVSDVSSALTQGDGTAIDTELRTRKAEGTIAELQEKAIFSTYFRTSEYTTFLNSVNAQTISKTVSGLLIPWDIHYLITYITNGSNFDEAEIVGNQFTYSKPLVSFEAVTVNNSFFTNYIDPLIYEGYPIDGDIKITYRNTSELGLIPVKAVSIYQSKENLDLTESDITSGSHSPASNISKGYYYNLAYYMANDFYEIQNKVVSRYINGSSFTDRIKKIIEGRYPLYQPENYKVNIRYTLPGNNSINSSKQLFFNYE